MASYKSYDSPEWEKRIREACEKHQTMFSACKALNMPYTSFKKYAEKFGCWEANPGRIGMTRSISECDKLAKIPIEEILQGLHPYYSYGHLKRRLLRRNILKNECELCHITEWKGKKLVMHMDHIDGNNRNHKRENLRMLCPNCHSQTPTYSGKDRTNVNYYKLSESEIKNAVESSFTYEEVYRKLNVYGHLGSAEKLKNQIHRTPYQLMKKQKLEKKENVWVEEVRRRNVAAIERNADLVLKVRDSGIDFSKFGWVGQVAKLLNKQPQKVNVWMKRYAQDIYENAFKRK